MLKWCLCLDATRHRHDNCDRDDSLPTSPGRIAIHSAPGLLDNFWYIHHMVELYFNIYFAGWMLALLAEPIFIAIFMSFLISFIKANLP